VDVYDFFRKWLALVPHPFTEADQLAGYRYELSVLQAEFSLTQALDRPHSGRASLRAAASARTSTSAAPTSRPDLRPPRSAPAALGRPRRSGAPGC
jgi:hypothetical protein